MCHGYRCLFNARTDFALEILSPATTWKCDVGIPKAKFLDATRSCVFKFRLRFRVGPRTFSRAKRKTVFRRDHRALETKRTRTMETKLFWNLLSVGPATFSRCIAKWKDMGLNDSKRLHMAFVLRSRGKKK